MKRRTTTSSSSRSRAAAPSSSSSASKSGGRRYATNETRGASEYKKEWGQFMTGIHKKRVGGGGSSSSLSGGPSAAQQPSQVQETSGIKPCMDLSAMAGSTFSYLFDAKKVKNKSDRAQVQKEAQREAEEKRKASLARKREMIKQREREKQQQQLQDAAVNDDDDDENDESSGKESGKRRTREDDDQQTPSVVAHHHQPKRIFLPPPGWGVPLVSEAPTPKPAFELPDHLYTSKMEKAEDVAKDVGLDLSGLNRKQRRQALQLTESAADRKVLEKRKKTTVQDLMDVKLQWYQQGPYPLDEITEKLVNRKALKHAKVRPELNLSRYNWELIHPSWMAARQRRRHEKKNCFGTGEHVKFSDSDDE